MVAATVEFGCAGGIWHWELFSVYYIGQPLCYETATGGLCVILLHSASDYRPNDCTCWYNETNLNTNSNFANKVRILGGKSNLTYVVSTLDVKPALVAYKYMVFVDIVIQCGVIFCGCNCSILFAIISNIWLHLIASSCIMRNNIWWSVILLVALAKVEAVTGQTPTLPVMKSEQKPPALTADALKLSHEVEPQAEVKPVTQLVQSVRVYVNSPVFCVLMQLDSI